MVMDDETKNFYFHNPQIYFWHNYFCKETYVEGRKIMVRPMVRKISQKQTNKKWIYIYSSYTIVQILKFTVSLTCFHMQTWMEIVCQYF